MGPRNKIYKIDGYSVTGLIANLLSTTQILFVPAIVVKIAGHDAWIAPLISCLSGIYLLYILYRLSILFPGLSIIEYLPLIVGKLAGKVIGLGYMLVIILLTGTVIRETLMLYYGTEILRYTPQAIVLILIIFTTTYGVVAGIEVIARTLNLYWIMLTIIFIVYLGLAIPFGKLDCLLPVGEAGLLTILKSSLLPQAYTAELFLLAMLLPYCRSSREAFTAGNIANLGITFIFIMIMIASVAVMGEKTTARALFTPFYLADFIQPVGIKVFLIFIWGIGVWGKTALMQFTLTDGISQIIGLKEHRPVFWPIAIILMISSITMYQNAIEVLEKVSHIFPGMMLIFGYLIPTLLLIIALIKRKFSNQWMKDLKSSA